MSVGQVAFVTGAASGIGRALCQGLVARGARVIAADRDLEGAETVARSLGPSLVPLELDVTDPDSFGEAVRGVVRDFGRLDMLFNNAGVGLAGQVRDLGLAEWHRVFDVNVWGVVHGIHAAYPVMVRQGHGHIVNTASGAGLVARPGMVPYAAAKHAVVGLSTSLRAEAHPLGVNVSVACPGYVATKIMSSTRYVGVNQDRLTKDIPVKPIGAEACAKAILQGMDRDEAIIVISKLVRIEWALNRLSPRLGVALGRLRGQRFHVTREAGGPLDDPGPDAARPGDDVDAAQ